MAKIYIGGLPPPEDCDERDIEDQFGRYGRFRDIWVARKPSGFAFVTYEDDRDAVPGDTRRSRCVLHNRCSHCMHPQHSLMFGHCAG